VQVTALVENSGHVCCRYRLAAFRPFLESAGHRLEFRQLPATGWGWMRLRQDLQAADVVLLQRRLLKSWQLHLLRRASRTLVFDFDDAVFLRDSYHVKGIHSPGRQRRFAAIVQAADVLVAGNCFLRDQAARWAHPDRVHVVPTCVNPDLYPLAGHVRDVHGVQMVWIGSSSTLRGLHRAQPILERLGHRWPGLHLKVVCDRFLHFRHLPALSCPWSEENEAALLAAADIGISWVPDDLWSRGKCGLKVLQYMAAGLPVVANPVGVHAEIVRHGETGFLAETPEQWIEAIGRLARNPLLRRQMGRAGRRRLEEVYSVHVGAARWLEVLERLQQRRKAA
jgi:glycosyltransferase involved in cell wall biosynthesis